MKNSPLLLQNAELDKDLIKDAIREVMDEIAVNFAHGAGILVDSIMKSFQRDNRFLRSVLRQQSGDITGPDVGAAYSNCA